MNTLGLDRISPSMLMEYQNCPKLFYYRSWLGLKLPQAQRHLRFGTAIHLAVDSIYEQFTDNDKWKNAELKLVKDIFKKNWSKDCIGDDEFSTLTEKDTCYEDMKEDGLEILTQFWSKKEELFLDGFEPISFEVKYKDFLFHPLTKEKFEVPHSMRFDSLAKRHRIGEFKTSGKPYDVQETRDSLQSLSYALAYYCQHGVIPQLDYIVMIKKRKKDKIQHIPIVYNLTDLLRYVERVNAIFDKIKNREFSPPSKGHAPYCDCQKFDRLLTNKNK